MGSPRVLVVDDDPDTLTLMTSILTDAGFIVDHQSDLTRARAALSNGRFELILTDLYLGDERLGYEIAEFAHALRPPVPVVLVTARPSFANAREAMRSHICEIVVKPVDGATLVSACRRAVEQFQIRRRNDELQTQNQTLMDVLPRAIEAKDPTTEGHSQRVVQYADVLAKKCGVNDEDRASLRVASLLHDVGKIGIPNSILQKDGPLTTAEREVIQTHPTVGYDILEPLKYSESVRRWVHQHHERHDGKGYPQGIGGEELELPGSILILAEVFDALASARSYKPAWETSRISELMRFQAGKHFNPELAHLVADGLDQEGSKFFRAADKQEQLF